MAGVEKFKVTDKTKSCGSTGSQFWIQFGMDSCSLGLPAYSSAFETAVYRWPISSWFGTSHFFPSLVTLKTIQTSDLQENGSRQISFAWWNRSNSTGYGQVIGGKVPPVTYNDKALAKVFRWSKSFAKLLRPSHRQRVKVHNYRENRVFAFIGSNSCSSWIHHDSMVANDAAFAVSVPYAVENALTCWKNFNQIKIVIR